MTRRHHFPHAWVERIEQERQYNMALYNEALQLVDRLREAYKRETDPARKDQLLIAFQSAWDRSARRAARRAARLDTR